MIVGRKPINNNNKNNRSGIIVNNKKTAENASPLARGNVANTTEGRKDGPSYGGGYNDPPRSVVVEVDTDFNNVGIQETHSRLAASPSRLQRILKRPGDSDESRRRSSSLPRLGSTGERGGPVGVTSNSGSSAAAAPVTGHDRRPALSRQGSSRSQQKRSLSSRLSFARQSTGRGDDEDDVLGYANLNNSSASTSSSGKLRRLLMTPRPGERGGRGRATGGGGGAAVFTPTDLASEQLLKWKAEAEEGPHWLQMVAFLLALGAIGTTLYPIVMDDDDGSHWNGPVLVCAFHTVNLCTLILVFELRGFGGSRGPWSVRARARALASRLFNVLRLLWGRGLLYAFAGSMNWTIGHPLCVYTASGLVFVGLVAVLVGARASFNLDRLRTGVTDEVYLWVKFNAVDDDRDEMIDIDGFSSLVWSLGLEIDDEYAYRAFAKTDSNADGLISFEEFHRWWFQGKQLLQQESQSQSKDSTANTELV